MSNPFELLGITPWMVSLLRRKPPLLRKIAANNRKYLQATVHPDISGKDDLSKQINEALDLLYDDEDFQEIAEQYITSARVAAETTRERILKKELEACKASLVANESALWDARNDLKEHRRENTKLNQQVNALAEQLFVCTLLSTPTSLSDAIRDSDLTGKYVPIAGKGVIEVRKGFVTETYVFDGGTRECWPRRRRTSGVLSEQKSQKMVLIGCSLSSKMPRSKSISKRTRWEDLRSALRGVVPFLRVGFPVIVADVRGKSTAAEVHTIGDLVRVRDLKERVTRQSKNQSSISNPKHTSGKRPTKAE